MTRAPSPPGALTRADAARLAQKRQSEALAAATAEYRRLNPPWATGDRLAVSINANPRWFWGGRMRDTSAAEAARLAGDRAISTLCKARITGISCEKSYMTLLLPRLPW